MLFRSPATYSAKSNHSRLVYKYKGPDTKVTGKVKTVPAPPQNPDAYGKMLTAMGMPVPAVNAWSAQAAGSTRTQRSGAAAE